MIMSSSSLEPLETYMIVNFMVRGINRGTRKLTQTPMLILKKTIYNIVLRFTYDTILIP
jgi:hypothetical protein